VRLWLVPSSSLSVALSRCFADDASLAAISADDGMGLAPTGKSLLGTQRLSVSPAVSGIDAYPRSRSHARLGAVVDCLLATQEGSRASPFGAKVVDRLTGAVCGGKYFLCKDYETACLFRSVLARSNLPIRALSGYDTCVRISTRQYPAFDKL
jgi:hypothetical protein